MSNILNVSRTWLIGGWLAMLAVILAVTVAMDASRSTSAVVLALGLAGPVIIVLLGTRAPVQTIAEILHTAETKDAR